MIIKEDHSFAKYSNIECRFWKISDNIYRLQTEKNYISLSKGFKKYDIEELTNKVFIDVLKKDIQSAYYVDTYGNYKGYKCQILGINNNIASLNPSIEYQAMSKDHAKHGYDPQLEVDINELKEIWEERIPIEGFKFDVKPIFYLKKKEL